MGYSTKFKGELKFKEPLTVPQIAELNKYLGESWSEGYVQFELNKALDGIKWDGSEKFYKAVECVNFLTAKMREQWPDFAFTGELAAQGEEMEDRWRLVVDEKGVAYHVSVPMAGSKVRCPHCDCDFYIDENGKPLD